MSVMKYGDRTCTVADCDQTPVKDGVCGAHHARKKNNGAVDAFPERRPHKLTDEQRAEIVRRVRAFEAPAKIASDLGINKKTVHDVMRTRS